MKFKNEDMFRNIMVMRDIHETGKLGYAIARNMRKMTDAAKEYMDIREDILKKYGNETDDGLYMIPKDKTADFSREMGEYSGIEHDVDVFFVSESDFLNSNMDTQQMFALDWMISQEGNKT